MPIKSDGVVSAIYYCEKCGQPMGLLSHHINDDGSISPSVVCPNPVYAIRPPTPELANHDMRMPTLDCPKCDFHNHITLIGWGRFPHDDENDI